MKQNPSVHTFLLASLKIIIIVSNLISIFVLQLNQRIWNIV